MRTLVYSCLLSLMLSPLWAITPNKFIEKKARVSLPVEKDVNIEIDGTNTEMQIEIWDQPRIEVVATFRYRGERASEKIATFMEEFQDNVAEGIQQSPGAVRIETYRSLPKQIKIGSKDFVIFAMTYSRDEVQLEYHIKMPAKGKVNIRHSYRDLRIMGDIPQLDLYQYSGRLAMDNIEHGKLTLKYGEAVLKNLGRAQLYLYENDLRAEDIQQLDLNIKYCQLQVESVDVLSLQAYESDLQFLELKKFRGNLKYSSLQAQSVEDLELDSYESNYTFQKLINAELRNSKYSRYTIGRIEKLKISQAYEDKMLIKNLSSLEAGNSKYCKYDIQNLGQKLYFDGYESKLNLEKLGASQGEIGINGKYIKASVNTEGVLYRLNASIQYGDIDYRASEVEALVEEKGSRTTAQIRSKGIKKGEGYSILVNGYEMSLRLY